MSVALEEQLHRLREAEELETRRQYKVEQEFKKKQLAEIKAAMAAEKEANRSKGFGGKFRSMGSSMGGSSRRSKK